VTKLFDAPTRIEAWLDAAEYLLEVRTDLNVILSISSPSSDGPMSRESTARVDEFLTGEGEYPLYTVAETIFPGWEYRRRGLDGVFTIYPEEEYPKFIKRNPNGWGTYAYRLVRRTRADGTTMNPLEHLISKMRTEIAARGTKKSCYEVGIAEGEYDVPLYNTVDDNSRHMGGPCLSHLSFKVYEGHIHLTAFYRSHCYRYKALGNLLGLARLQACVAQEVGQPMGSLVVHSSYAFMTGAKGRAMDLINGLRRMRADMEEQQDGLAEQVR